MYTRQQDREQTDMKAHSPCVNLNLNDFNNPKNCKFIRKLKMLGQIPRTMPKLHLSSNTVQHLTCFSVTYINRFKKCLWSLLNLKYSVTLLLQKPFVPYILNRIDLKTGLFLFIHPFTRLLYMWLNKCPHCVITLLQFEWLKYAVFSYLVVFEPLRFCFSFAQSLEFSLWSQQHWFF